MVRGAALSFRDLQHIGLRRCSGLTDDALSVLLRSQRRPHQVLGLHFHPTQFGKQHLLTNFMQRWSSPVDCVPLLQRPSCPHRCTLSGSPLPALQPPPALPIPSDHRMLYMLYGITSSTAMPQIAACPQSARFSSVSLWDTPLLQGHWCLATTTCRRGSGFASRY